ncbi:MAG: hypothetical protein GC160_22405 [Acidobacteria bacterium]|nr:hypothetical protein [Acidobacteriota bacterium]
MRRAVLLIAFLVGLGLALGQEGLRPQYAARVRVTTKLADTGEKVPARVYLLKGGAPYRLSPVDAQLPLRVDSFYRERLWRQDRPVKTLEVTARDQSHFVLTEGEAEFDLPGGHRYRLEAYHGFLYKPAVVDFTLAADEERTVELTLEPTAPGEQGKWLAADDHIHLVRAPEDDRLFLDWLRAEDLAVGNFLELQRQQHAAMQYGFGKQAEARAEGYSIRSGHESRSRFYGHVLGLGGERMVRPLSIGLEYANTRDAWPRPGLLFERIRKEGGLAGFAHFWGSQPNSSLLMDLAHGDVDFVELFQFGVLHTEEWYELLNAGFRVVGLAGSDFPANVGRLNPWPHFVPLLGPERAMVKAEAGESAYEAWAAGVKRGAVTLSNGPLLDFEVEGCEPGASVEWSGATKTLKGRARAWFHRPLYDLEIVVNGEVVARSPRGEPLEFEAEIAASSWVAARVRAEELEGEPPIHAHANPVYFLQDGKPVYLKPARQALAARWDKEAQYYRNAPLLLSAEQRRELLERVAATEKILASAPQ